MTEPHSMDQAFIRKLTDLILANLGNENFGAKELAHESGMSNYRLNRRLRTITNKTTNQYIREIRLQKALEMLINEEVTASEVAYRVGFGSPAYFTTCFHEFFGYPPGKVKKEGFDSALEIHPVQVPAIQEQKGTPWRTFVLISSGILFLAVLTYLGYNVFLKKSSVNAGLFVKNQEKSLAVLPFKNLSDSTANQYFIDGVMEDILTNLSRIHDLRVIARTSVEQFRESPESASEIGKKLNVDYIVEGSGQKYGNIFHLRVQLIEASKDRHVWAESYEQEIRETKDIFIIQSRIAQSIVAELKAMITPEEIQLIEKIPTSSLSAYDFYQRGGEELRKYKSDRSNVQALKRAEELFNKALEYDSTYAMAYVGLGNLYYTKHMYDSYYSEKYLDSVLVWADHALSYDAKLAEAYFIRGDYYLQNGKGEEAIKEYDKALKYNPNYWEAYWSKGWWVHIMDYKYMDFVKAIEYLHKSIGINQGTRLPDFLRGLGDAYGLFAGFPEKAKYFYQEAFNLDGDSTKYLSRLADGEKIKRNFKRAIELYKKCYIRDSNNVDITLRLADAYCMAGQFNESLIYIKKSEEKLEARPAYFYSAMKVIGYVYWQNGLKEEAEKWFNKQKKISEESIKMGRYYSVDANYDLAAVYAFMGDKGKAYENLRIVAKISVCPLWLSATIKDDPLFNNIRNESGFREIVIELEGKYQAEHERVRKWLEDQGML